MDTIPLPMMQFARADLLAFQNRNDACFQTLDSITNSFPDHSLTDEIIFLKAFKETINRPYNKAAALIKSSGVSISTPI